MKITDRPIPGQSLTVEPRSQAYERPPEIVDPIEALDVHLDNLSKEGALEDAMYFLEAGVDLQTLVQGVLRSAVMEGIHSIDVSLIIAPVVHEYIKGFADAAGVEYDEGFEDKQGKQALSYRRNAAMAKKMMKELDDTKEEPVDMAMEETEEPSMVMEEPQKTGLMARVG
tara:strand:- start:1025 stop:1534 length:510 start_codon:yes stop_codon:yes gene_type:complete